LRAARIPQMLGIQGYPKEIHAFILASFVNSTGNSLMWPLTTIYVHNILHRTYGEAGLVLLLQSLAGVVGQIFGGALFHRLGVKLLVIGSLLLTGLSQLSLIFAVTWPLYLSLMIINGFLIAVTMPVINAFIGFQWPEHRSTMFNVIYVSNNIGVAFGTMIAGVLASFSFALTFLFNGSSTILFALFFSFYLRKISLRDTDELVIGQTTPDPVLGAGQMLMSYKVYLFLALGSMTLWFATAQWNSGVAPYINQRGMSMEMYSFLWTVNGIFILVGQPLTTWLNRRFTKSLSSRLVVSTLCYFVGFAYILFLYHQYVHLVIGMVICTVGEMLISPTIPEFLTAETGQAAPFYLGVVGGFSSVGRLVGPYVYGNMFDRLGIVPIFILTTVVTLLSALLFMMHSVLNKRRIYGLKGNVSM